MLLSCRVLYKRNVMQLCECYIVLWLLACALLGIGTTPMGVLLAITVRRCPQSMNDPHLTTTQGPGKHKSFDRNYKSFRISLATFILLACSIGREIVWSGEGLLLCVSSRLLDLHWHLFLFCSSLPCFVMSRHPICKLPTFSFLGLYQTFRCRRIYRGWPPARTWLVASMNKKWTLPWEVVLCL